MNSKLVNQNWHLCRYPALEFCSVPHTDIHVKQQSCQCLSWRPDSHSVHSNPLTGPWLVLKPPLALMSGLTRLHTHCCREELVWNTWRSQSIAQLSYRKKKMLNCYVETDTSFVSAAVVCASCSSGEAQPFPERWAGVWALWESWPSKPLLWILPDGLPWKTR